MPVRYRYQSIIDFVETQSVNVSKTGMFVGSDQPLAVGTLVQFEFSLADGFVILKGSAEVVRAVPASADSPKGMGLRFVDLPEASRKLIERIVEVNEEEGKMATVPLSELLTAAAPPPSAAAAPRTTPSGGGTMAGANALAGATAAAPVGQGPKWERGPKLTLPLNATTAGYFVYNPLLNIKMGGFVVPVEAEIPLGTIIELTIIDAMGKQALQCKGKVVAKQEKRVGIRLQDPDKAGLAKIQADVNRLAPQK